MIVWPWLVGGGAAIAVLAWPSDAAPTPPTPGPPPPRPPPASSPIGPARAWGIPVAVGNAAPLWPLDLVGRRVVSDDLGECRPRGPCSRGIFRRHHAGEDLRAPRGTIVLATEPGEVIVADDDWYEGSGALLVATDSGIVLNFGEVEPGSWRALGVDVGTRVGAGQAIARVGRHHQLHFEAYREGTRTTSQWVFGAPAPTSLLDPVPYLEVAARSA